jgi:hypothetical protein
MAGEYNQEWITLGEVVPFLSRVLGIERTRQTVHNWAVNGVKRGVHDKIYLRSKRRAGIRYTQRQWVREFVDEISA